MRVFALETLLLPFAIVFSLLAQSYAISFLPAGLQQNIQNRFNGYGVVQYFLLPFQEPSPLVMQTFENASPQEFWDRAKNLGDRLGKYTDELLEQASKQSQAVLEDVNEFKNTMTKVVDSARRFRLELEDSARVHDVGKEDLEHVLDQAFQKVLDEMKEMFPSPNRAPTHGERVEMVNRTMDRVEVYLIDVATKRGMKEERVRHHLDSIRPAVESIVVIAGDLVEQHPALLQAILLTGVAMLIPEYVFLRPLLSLFGFGPGGPIKGSAAAWAQRRFFGAAVPSGSWFAHLQRAGMKGVWRRILGPISVGVGVGASVGMCGGR